MSEDMISANLHLFSDGEVSKLGTYQFRSLPKVGKQIMIGDDPADVWLRVESVTHVPVPQDETDWIGTIILNCEIDV